MEADVDSISGFHALGRGQGYVIAGSDRVAAVEDREGAQGVEASGELSQRRAPEGDQVTLTPGEGVPRDVELAAIGFDALGR